MPDSVRKRWVLGCLLFAGWGAILTPAWAATIPALSCADAEVQAKIDAAAGGDTVTVPAGDCTWNNTVTISGKALTLRGAGIGATNITDNGSGGGALAVDGASAANFVRVTGFTFIEGASHPNGIIQIDGAQAAVAFRFDHNRLFLPTGSSRGLVVIDVYGLMDHVTVDETGIGNQSVSLYGSQDGTDGGFTPWTRPLTLGTENAVYIEDCTLNYPVSGAMNDSGFDSYGGARWVIRHNAIHNTEFAGGHGTDSGDRRSLFSGEVYDNTVTNDSPSHFRGSTIRGGTVVFFNNTYGGSGASFYDITLLVYRACPPLDQSTWGTCDGTNWELGSMNLSAQASRTSSLNGGVRFCSGDRDRLCALDADCSAVGAGTCSTYFDGAGPGGYACRDQPGRTHGQVLAPVYAWNNGGLHIGTYDGGYACGLGLGHYLQAGRDYIDGTPMPGYTPYVYPHPLQGAGGSPTPAPPPAGPGAGPLAPRVYPNPWRADQAGLAPKITFANLPAGCTIRIFATSGRLVRDLPPGTAEWDLLDRDGKPAGSGLYLYLITDAQGRKATGKLGVIR